MVDLAEQDDQVTLETQPARLPVHGGDSIVAPIIELPRVWAFQAGDGHPSVLCPVLRAQGGDIIGVRLYNTNRKRLHTVYFRAVRKTWEDDGVPTRTGITVDPGETNTYGVTVNVPGTHVYHCHYQAH